VVSSGKQIVSTPIIAADPLDLGFRPFLLVWALYDSGVNRPEPVDE
jgi:hypothetical protein